MFIAVLFIKAKVWKYLVFLLRRELFNGYIYSFISLSINVHICIYPYHTGIKNNTMNEVALYILTFQVGK